MRNGVSTRALQVGKESKRRAASALSNAIPQQRGNARNSSAAQVAVAETLRTAHKAQVSSDTAKISSKGQLTMPLEVRNRLGVGAGDQVEFFFDGERTVVRPVRSEVDPFAKWVGVAKNVPAGFDPIAWQREIRGWDAWDVEHFG